MTVAAVLTLLACAQDSWHLSVYPTGNHMESVLDMGEFPTLEACREAATQILTAMGTLGRGTWECGKNCRADGQVLDITLYTCEETLR